MRRLVFLVLCFCMVFSLSGCSSRVAGSSLYSFPEPTQEIVITHTAGGQTREYAVVEMDGLNSVMNWFYQLELTKMDGPPEVVEGNEGFSFVVDGKHAFSYDHRGSEGYLYIEDAIYEVKPGRKPPFPE